LHAVPKMSDSAREIWRYGEMVKGGGGRTEKKRKEHAKAAGGRKLPLG